MKPRWRAVLAGLLVAGCETTNQGLGPLSPSDIDRYTSVRWLVTQPILRPVPAESMYVYLRVRNSAGLDVPIEGAIAADLQARGYKVTQELDKAWYYLNIDIRHVDKGRLPNLGTIAAGSSIGQPGQESKWAPSPASPAATKSFSQQVSAADVCMVVDIVSGERVPKGKIVRQVSTRGAQGQGEGGDALTRGSTPGRGASAESGSIDTQEVTTEDIFVFYANRAAAITKNRRVKVDEALPVLTQRLGKAMASALP